MRTRATSRALEGTPEQAKVITTFNAPSNTEERWWPTIRQTYVRKTFQDISILQKIEGYNFLYNNGVKITNANDWSDDDIWSVAWSYMIPVICTVQDQPTDDGRFQLTIEHSIALGMYLLSDCQNCTVHVLRDLKPNSVIRVYYRSSAILDKYTTKLAYYTANPFLQNNERMLKIVDGSCISPNTHDRGMISLNQAVYHELNVSSKVSVRAHKS